MIDPLIDGRTGEARPAPRRARPADRAPAHRPDAPRRRLIAGLSAAALLIVGIAAATSDRSGDGSAAADGGVAPAPVADVATVQVQYEPVDPRRAAAAGFGDTATPDESTDDAASPVSSESSPPSGSDETPPDDLPDLVDAEPGDVAVDGECVMTTTSLRLGASGADVVCLQTALAEAGVYRGPLHGQFDNATFAAASKVQEERNLFVDGVVGRETALSLGIWPDEDDLVVRTPPPPPGALDLHGFPLSSVASAGSAAPPLPENSGSGKRVVYDRMGQRVWAVDADGRIVRSWLVSGSMYANELPGTHTVYSRSEWSTAWNGAARLPLMIRWLQTERGHIGFHGIPIRVSDGQEYQTEAELGTRLSGGCQRQSNRDAEFLWHFAPEGTRVVVT